MPTELIIVLVVGLLLLFSAKKLPDMARGLGQSMRVFKAETRGLREDEQSARSSAQTSGTPADDSGARPGAGADSGSGAGQSRALEPGEPGGVTSQPLTVDGQTSHNGPASRGAARGGAVRQPAASTTSSRPPLWPQCARPPVPLPHREAHRVWPGTPTG